MSAGTRVDASALSRQQGVALVAALFMMVVLAVLGTAAVRLAGVQQQTVNLAMLGGRAYQAVQTGIEWGAYQALVNGSCGATTLNLVEVGLAGFDVDVSCSSSTHTEGGSTTTVYTLDAFARAGSYGQPDYVSRRMRATIRDTI